MLRFKNSISFKLLVCVQAMAAGTFSIRGITREETFTFNVVAAGTGVKETFEFGVSDIPILLSATDPDGNFGEGELYVTMALEINGTVVYEFASGYVFQFKSISYPGIGLQATRTGGGILTQVSAAAPAAGAEATITVPAGEIWKIHTISVQLVTDANVANRRVHILVDDGSGIGIEMFTEQDQAAGLTRNYSFAQYGILPDTIDGNAICAPLPANLFTVDSLTISTVTQNIQVGDQYNQMVLSVEKIPNLA